MSRVCMLVFVAGLWLEMHGLLAELTEENTGVFVSQQTAHTVLRRLRRYNSGFEEVLHKDNLERECKEETCSYEEAREVFENDEKTMEFWVGYIDGDQCDPQPCQNGGQCQDGVGSYICWCKPNFGGKNCEIEVSKQCSVDNGGCSHFCVMQVDRAVCQCAAGYRLGTDKKSCEPTAPFSCGRVILPSRSVTRTFLSPRSSNTTRSFETKHNSSDALADDYYDEEIPLFYDYLDSSVNYTDALNISQASAVDVHSVKSDSDTSVRKARSVTESPTEKSLMPSWAFPTMSTIFAKENDDQRIVGGDTAIPGEIPWQVALMSHSAILQRAQPFCGGSLLSELWVITAAHCLVQADVAKKGFFVRAGEHDITEHEGPERDHVVAEQYMHPLYNFNKSPYNHDIALLKLATPVELSNQRTPICLGPKAFIQSLLRESSTSLVSGWGRLKFLGLEATKLQKLGVPYVDRTRCKQSSRDHITRFMFCAGFSNEQKDSCQGDSGGPHATYYKGTWFLTGIVSWGEECAKDGKYGIYTRMSQYYPWISRTTGIQITN
ncbi:coagulation factor IXb isoform X2 [Acanthochromis polyacanthus]|uniref:Coagulation factor IX n=1 Tax=Acanthochromis polyacanthus TaxID=80966 RepID=A0A3Q1EGV9_9TELE|nr:coagulation factor IXb isoform X2 [Acanthochromis polyacanthus]